MRLSEDSRIKFEKFLNYLTGENLIFPAEVKIYAGKFADFITKKLKVDGVTIGKRILIRSRYIWQDENLRLCAAKPLIAHEIAHVLQYQKYGLIKFLYIYLRDYWTLLKKKEKWDYQARREAYLEIPFEIEARRFAADYSSWRD